jgi:hypothetical protein
MNNKLDGLIINIPMAGLVSILDIVHTHRLLN